MHELICQACSNGCALTVTRQDVETLVVDGNMCPKGLGYAHHQLHTIESGTFKLRPRAATYTKEDLLPTVGLFGLTLHEHLPNVFIQGSPDRSEYRTVFTDTLGQKYILEQVLDFEHRQTIATQLAQFAESGLPVVRYVGDCIQTCRDARPGVSTEKHWQISPFIVGVPLDRSSYWQDAWRGKAVADFLQGLYQCADNTVRPQYIVAPTFSLKKYIENLLQKICENRPQLLSELADIIEYVQTNFFPVHDQLAIGFCHGDPHPLNMLWGEDKVIAVIDWEFSGLKPRLYDSALIIGCVGVESPDSLEGSFIKTFIDTIELPDKEYLWLFVLALRFAWISEWLRRDDQEMLAFEINYMRHIMNVYLKPQ